MTEGNDRPRSAKLLTVDRFLLLVVICIQVFLLVRVLGTHTTPTQSSHDTPHAAHPNTPDARTGGFSAAPPPVPHAPATRPVSTRPLPPRGMDMDELMHEHLRQMQDMQEAVEDQFRHMARLADFDSGWDMLPASPTMDMRETKDNYELVFSLPGEEGTNIEIRLNGQMLTVQGTSRSDAPGRQSERSFASTIVLPGPVSDAAIPQPTVSNGILRLTLPKQKDTNSAMAQVF